MTSLSYAGSVNDPELVTRCKANDEHAYFEVFNRYSKEIFNCAYSILKEESAAEDALQETFLNIFRGIKNFRGDAKLATWINRITVNVCLGILRKNRQQKKAIDSDVTSDACERLPTHASAGGMPAYVNPYTNVFAEEIKTQVHAALDKLGHPHKMVLKLHDLDGLTVEEIAKIVHCPSGTVKSRLFYGRKEFKDAYANL